MKSQQPSMMFFIEKVLSPASYLLTCEIRGMTYAHRASKSLLLIEDFFCFYKEAFLLAPRLKMVSFDPITSKIKGGMTKLAANKKID
jgi:hypothetical protein